MNIYIGTIHIESIEGASCVNLGNNRITDFKSYKKQNQGFGSISGDHNEIKDLRSMLSDRKTIDMLNYDETDKAVEQLIKETLKLQECKKKKKQEK